MRRNRLFIVGIFTAGALILAACSSTESGGSSSTTVAPATTTTAIATAPTTTNAPEPPTTTKAPTTTMPAVLEATCDWNSPRLAPGDTSGTPTSTEGDVAEAILGSWQHVAIDSGSGFEFLDATRDIRYVLAADRFLYCQDVEGATDQAENSAPLKVEGAQIVLPSPATGYEVVAWNEDTMVWRNLRDDSLYLLKRR